MFPIKNILKKGDVLTALLFNFALDYAIKERSGKIYGLKLNDIHQLLFYADEVNILG
jgi:hypothetical protein